MGVMHYSILGGTWNAFILWWPLQAEIKFNKEGEQQLEEAVEEGSNDEED